MKILITECATLINFPLHRNIYNKTNIKVKKFTYIDIKVKN